MSEDNETTTPYDDNFEPEPDAPRRNRWSGLRERTFGIRGAAAVGLAGLVIGGGGGFGLAAATHHDDGHRPGDMGQQWRGQMPGDRDDVQGHPGPPMGGMPGGGLPPTAPPDTESDSGGSNS